jgi:V8-like Glu-specific endopeptidase
MATLFSRPQVAALRYALAGTVCCAALPAAAQPSISGEAPSVIVATATQADVPPGVGLLFATTVRAPGAVWLRLDLSGTRLNDGDGDLSGVTLRLRSERDGAVQHLDEFTLDQWLAGTAFFNGEAVHIEFWADAPTDRSLRLAVPRVWAGVDPGPRVTPADLCGTDDRLPSTDFRMGRLSIGCTANVIDDRNRMMLTAGHCISTSSAGVLLLFNTPPSSASGATQFPPPDDQFAVEQASIQSQSGGVGNDWAYFGTLPNTNHGQTPAQRYGVWLNTVAAAPVPVAGSSIRITGYGTVSSPVSPTRNATQQTSTGPYNTLTGTRLRYTVDTTGGNSGSAVLLLPAEQVIGIHSHAGCNSGGNQGTAMQQANLRAAMLAPRGVCASGSGTIAGDLFALGDNANNFGTLAALPAGFGRIAQVGSRWMALDADPLTGGFLAIDRVRNLVAISPAGVVSNLGVLGGAAGVPGGLTVSADGQTLFSTLPGTGQLLASNRATLTATVRGPTRGSAALLRAVQFDPARNVLWAIALNPATPADATSRALLAIDPGTGATVSSTPVNRPGLTIADLALEPSGNALLAFDPTTATLVRVSLPDGAVTSAQTTGGSWGAAMGLAFRIRACPADVASIGGLPPADGLLTGDDFNAFVAAFAAGDPLSDIAGIGGAPGSDGLVTGDDFNAFIAAFAGGCP